MPQSSTRDSMKQLITLRLGAAGFGQHWKHCDLVANYLATFTSELLNKSESQENLVSTVLNELLEVVFRRNSGAGEIGITLSGDKKQLVVEILVPVGEADREFYTEMAQLVRRQDRDELHTQQLAEPQAEEHNLSWSLLQLATVYEAILGVIDVGDGNSVRLELPFPVEP